MLETFKKNAIKNVLVSSIVMLVIGIALLVFQGAAAFYSLTSVTIGPKTFEDLSRKEIHNHMRVDVTLSGALGRFRYEYETTQSGQNLGTTADYYAIYSGGENEDIDYVLMAIKVPHKYYRSMENLTEIFNAGYWSNEPVHFYNAEIRRMTSSELSDFKDALGYTDAEFKEYCLPYVVDAAQNDNSMMGIAIILATGGIVLVLIGLIRLIITFTGSSLKKLKEDMAEAGVTEASLESDYNSAASFKKNGEIKVGRQFIYYISGSSPRLIPNSKLLWAYQSTTTHRRNGINVGTTYSIVMYVNDKRGSVTLQMPNEANTQEMLKRINATLPWVVVGYSDELKRLFNNDRAQFLGLRYNTVEHVAVEPGFENMNNVQ
ncbi:MAG: hypothetical protein J1E03_08465 [Acetatifactor sp.]|nr:hypothetical protein [Acetatifactor sp.]